MAYNSHDHKRPHKVLLQKKARLGAAQALYASFVASNLVEANNILDNTSFGSLDAKSKQVIKEAITNNSDALFLSRVIDFLLTLEDTLQSAEIINCIKRVNKTVVDEKFVTLTDPTNLSKLVVSPTFEVLLNAIAPNTLLEFNEQLNGTLLLASLDEYNNDALVDYALEATQRLIEFDKVSKDLLYTAILAEYDLGEFHEKAEQMFTDFSEADQLEALNSI